MADVEVVIKIDEDVYQGVVNADKTQGRWGNTILGILCTAIATGTSLQKGHGRLIDADRLKIDNPLHLGLDIPYVIEDTVEEIIDHAPTIIEADKEEE